MKLKNIFRLQELYYLFFARKVLGNGILQDKFFRMIIVVAGIILTISTTAFLYNFYDDTLVSQEIDFIFFIVQMQALNITVWTIISFILIKILFLKKGFFLRMTSQFPVTNQERNASFFLFEMIMSITIIWVISFASVVAIVLRSGIYYIPFLITAIFFTGTFIYLFLQLLYTILLKLLDFLKLTKLSSYILLLFFTGVLYSVYENIMHSTGDISDIQNFKHWTQLFISLHSQHGFLISFLVFVLGAVGLSISIIYIPNELYPQENLYVHFNLKIRNTSSLTLLYFIQLIRRVENYVNIVLSYCLACFLIVTGSADPLNAILINVLTGLYIYSQTDSIRVIFYKLNYNSLNDYVSLLLSQFIYMIVLSIPIVLFQLVSMENFFLSFSWTFYLTFLQSIVFSTLIGILFPTKKENPFSPFVGILIMVMIFSAVTLLIQFLGLTEIYTQICLFFLFLIMGVVSWWGITRLKEEATYEKT